MTSPGTVHVLVGDLFRSSAQTWVNTVNTVGVMGKGVALEFRRRFPEMHTDYIQRCERRQVRLGEPYIYKGARLPWIVNFPTKEHWRAVSSLDAIVRGLDHLGRNAEGWGITSLAVPPLGCGNGQLEWSVVGPTLYRGLRRVGVPVELYAPHGTPPDQMELAFLDRAPEATIWTSQQRLPTGALALVELLSRVLEEPYHWPVGHVTFEKMAYFATEAGLPTGLEFGRGSFGPHSPGLKRLMGQLSNNGLIVEKRLGRMIAITPGPTQRDASRIHAVALAEWRSVIDRLVDLFMRIRTTRQAEMAATVHFAARQITREQKDATEADVVNFVLDWKGGRWPEEDIAAAVRELAALGWLPNIRPTKAFRLPEAAVIG